VSVTPYSQHVGSRQPAPSNGSFGDGNSSGGSLGAGVLLSVALHAVLVGFVVFGLPIFWQPEPLPGAIGIELAQLSDITAAPKVQQEGPPKKQPEPQPAVKKEAPKKETPPPPPNPPAAAAPPPPPPEEEVAEAIPDPAAEKKKAEEAKKKEAEEEKKKREEEKKKKAAERKKKEEEKKKQQKKDDQALDALLANVLDQQPAPEPQKKPQKIKAEAKPAEPSTGPQTENVSEIPLTASEEDGIRGQIERNWNLGSLAGAADLTGMTIELRITLQPDGTVTRAQVINTGSSPLFRQASESAMRAVMISSPLKLPPGKTYTSMVIRFHPDQVVQ
jgi:outer membrane biosynthesis protein TonB